MRKTLLTGVLLAASLFIPTASKAQSLGGILKNVATSVASNSGTVGNILTSIIGTADVSAEDLVGSWTYASPAVVFESDNILNKAGGIVMQAAAEKKITAALTKAGFTKGEVKLNFAKDKTYNCLLSKRTASGTYEVSGANLSLSSLGIKTFSGNVKLSGNELQIAIPANKVLTIAKSLGSLAKANSTISTLSSFMKGYKGMLVGLKFVRK